MTQVQVPQTVRLTRRRCGQCGARRGWPSLYVVYCSACGRGRGGKSNPRWGHGLVLQRIDEHGSFES